MLEREMKIKSNLYSELNSNKEKRERKHEESILRLCAL
jgi:hypothetical protein